MKRLALTAAVMFVSTLALLNTVSAQLTAARYSQPSPSDPAVLSSDPSAPRLFEKVAFYPDRNLAQALADLRLANDRLALIVPQGDTYENEKKGQVANSARTTAFMVIAATKDFSIDARQMLPTRQSPGLVNMKDLMIQSLVSKSFSVEGRIVYFAPDAGAIVPWTWKEEGDRSAPAADMKGRDAWHQLFTANAGDMRTEIGRRT